ncbi:MAG: hypothetical protein ACREB5_07520 [Sphingomonadaceae bacterium]
MAGKEIGMFPHDSHGLDRQGLEDEILPGEDWPPDLKAALRELLEQITQAGRAINIQNLGLFLGDFMPRHTLDRAEEWQARAVRRWFTQTKPVLVERLADFFIGGEFIGGEQYPRQGSHLHLHRLSRN